MRAMRRQQWQRRSGALALIASPFLGTFLGGMLAIALRPTSDYAPAMALVAVYAGAIALIPMIGSGIAAWYAA